MSQSDETATGGRFTMSARRWSVVAVVVLLLLGGIGWVAFGTGSREDARSDTADSSTPAASGTETTSAAPSAALAQLSLNRNGNDVTLSGNLPDAQARSQLVATVKAQWVAATVVDNVTLAPGVSAPDLTGLSGLLVAVAGIADFGWTVHGEDLTLTGTAPNLDVASQVQSAAALAFPNLKLTNNLQIPASGAPPMTVPPAVAPNASPAPSCPTLQADIAALLRTPISFTTGGAELAGDSRQLVQQVAVKIKACLGVAVTVVGYTDNVGGEAINTHLSAVRAKAVADVLVSDGVAADHVSSRGAGSANPIASNDTPAGRAQNRRVAITVN